MDDTFEANLRKLAEIGCSNVARRLRQQMDDFGEDRKALGDGKLIVQKTIDDLLNDPSYTKQRPALEALRKRL